MKTFLKTIAGCCIALLSASVFTATGAETYPDRSINLVVVYSPGGTTDIVARIVGQALGKELKQSIVIENRPGAGGNIGTRYVARSAPDGYTLLIGVPGLTTNAALYSKLNYDPAKDFEPISLLASVPNVIVVNSASSQNSIKNFIEYGKSHRGKLNFGSAGPGTSSHLAGELFNEITGLNMTHVPYKGGVPALTDLASGRLDVMLIPLPDAIGLIRSGRLKALALANKRRSPLLPDVPTTKEAGLPDFEVGSWFGLLAPVGTPKSITEKLAAETVKALQTESVKEAFNVQGIELVASSSEQFQDFLKKETVRWEAVIKSKNIKLD